MNNENLKYEDVIRSTFYNQKEILKNIIKPHNNGEPFYCDMTYSTGKFYSTNEDDDFYVPQPTVKLDVEPRTEDTL